jgi:hypothetical protein
MPRPYKSLTADDIEAVLDSLNLASRKEVAERFDLRPSTVGTIKKNFAGKSRADIEEVVRQWNKYKKIFRSLFEEKYNAAGGAPDELEFTTADLARIQNMLDLAGGNPYDLKYNAKGRGSLPEEVQATAPDGKEWRIKATGKGEYVFKLFDKGSGIFEIGTGLEPIKVPDALPSIVERYARRDDEQALLARIRYNNLVSVFLGLTTHSLQSHWKTSVESSTPVEIDEMYVGLDRDGVHYSIPVEAKGKPASEKVTAEQILNNYNAASDTFPQTVVIPVAAKVVDGYTFAMMRFEVDPEAETVTKTDERHYTLAVNPSVETVPRPTLSDEDVRQIATNAGANLAIDKTTEEPSDPPGSSGADPSNN